MSFKKIETKATFLFIALIGSYTWFMFRMLFMNLDQSLYTSGGSDGIKNYYTYLYHCLYGKGSVFTGMNYPFNEHVAFTDNQPLLSIPLSYLRDYFHFGINDLLIIMNLIIPLGFIISGYFLFRFLLKLNINAYLSAFFALIILAMSPNLFRTFGHFGLAHTFFITGTLLFSFEYYEHKKIKYLVYLFLINLIAPFLHIYDLAISIILISCLSFAKYFIDNENKKEKLKAIAPPLFTIFSVFVIFKIFLSFTDKITDRPKNPWGILSYVTHGEQIFTSKTSQLGNAFNFIFGVKSGADFDEGYVYIGFLASLFCIYVILYFLFKLFLKKANSSFVSISKTQQIILLSGLLALLFSMGVPFVWNMDFLLDYITPLKQFRGLGRFSILFYFCITISMLLSIDIYFKQLFSEKKYLLLTFTTIVFLGISAIEVFSFGIEFQNRCDKSTENYSTFFDEVKSIQTDTTVINTTNFQGIIALPFFCVGSEKVGLGSSGYVIDEAFRYSLATRIPLFNTHLSRSSWTQSFALMRLVGGNFTDKKLITSKLNTKPILVFVRENENLQEGEKYLISQSSLLKKQDSWLLYSLNWQKLIANEKHYNDSLRNIDFTKIKNDTSIICNHFDNETFARTPFGKSCLQVSDKDSVVLYKGKTPSSTDSMFEFSVWTLVNNIDYRMPRGVIYLYDSTGYEMNSCYFSAEAATDNIGFWFRINYIFKVQKNYQTMKIILFNHDKKDMISLDEFQVRPIQSTSIYKTEKSILYNNHLVN